MNKFNKDVLILNTMWQPINIKCVFECIKDVLKGRAMFVNDAYVIYDFMEWIDYSNNKYKEDNTLIHFKLDPKNVFLLPELIKMDTKHLTSYRAPRLSKINVLRRDKFICQYCGKHGIKAEMNNDHVVPKAQGGKTTWDNLVASCKKCNHVKADRTPAEAGMKLKNQPYKPKWDIMLSKLSGSKSVPKSWKIYLPK